MLIRVTWKEGKKVGSGTSEHRDQVMEDQDEGRGIERWGKRWGKVID